MDTLKQVQLHQNLLSLGQTFLLKKYVAPEHISEDISFFEPHFTPYNPRKPQYNCYSLPLTSLDGGLSGASSIGALTEYNREHETDLLENNFRKRTPVFIACKKLSEAMEPFHKHIGRSYILRLNKGGYLPFHRSCVTLIPSVFRLLISFCDYEDFVFLLNDKRVFLNPGRVYFVNTCLAHCFFSFKDRRDFAVFNIDLCEDSVNAVLKHLVVR